MYVCVFRCNLPPAHLAEWPGSFTRHSCNTGMERTPNKSLEKKIHPSLLPGFELATFRSRVLCSINTLFRLQRVRKQLVFNAQLTPKVTLGRTLARAFGSSCSPWGRSTNLLGQLGVLHDSLNRDDVALQQSRVLHQHVQGAGYLSQMTFKVSRSIMKVSPGRLSWALHLCTLDKAQGY